MDTDCKLKHGIHENASASALAVLHVFQLFQPERIGGLYTYMESLCAALKGSGVNHSIASIQPGSAPRMNIPLAYAGRPGVGWLRRVWMFRHWLRSSVRQFDVVHVHGIYLPLFLSAQICRSNGVPYIVTPHGTLMPWRTPQLPPWWKLFRATIGPQLLTDSATVIATTPSDGAAVRAYAPAARMVEILPGLNIRTLQGRRRPDVDPGGLLKLVFVGRLRPVKGLTAVIDAMGLLQEIGTRVELHVVGTGDQEYVNSLLLRARDVGVPESLRMHGYLAGAARDAIMQEADVFIMNSQGENFSFATAEAMVAGLAVIISDQVGLSGKVREFGAGIVVPVDDVDAIAAALRTYAEPRRCREDGGRARHCAEKEFSLEASGLRLRDVYVYAAGQKPH